MLCQATTVPSAFKATTIPSLPDTIFFTLFKFTGLFVSYTELFFQVVVVPSAFKTVITPPPVIISLTFVKLFDILVVKPPKAVLPQVSIVPSILMIALLSALEV